MENSYDQSMNFDNSAQAINHNNSLMADKNQQLKKPSSQVIEEEVKMSGDSKLNSSEPLVRQTGYVKYEDLFFEDK